MLPIGIELIISVQSNWKRKKLKAIIEVRDISGQSNGKLGESIKAWEDKGIWQRAPRRSFGNIYRIYRHPCIGHDVSDWAG